APIDPGQARRALSAVERMGDEALRELRTLVAALQSDTGEPASLALERSISIEELVLDARRAGLDVELEEAGSPHPLDRGMQISVYRIVQEAITNIRRHASGAVATVRVLHGPNVVSVEVINGPGESGPVNGVCGAGQGLIGIAERVAAFGGWSDAAATSDGGFRVVAELPKEPALM